MDGTRPGLSQVVLKTMVTHTVTYFVTGFVALVVFDYARLYADPAVRGMMRQTTDSLVMAGPLFQPLRGCLYGVVFFLLRDTLLRHRRGWLVAWTVLVGVGVLGTFGPCVGSIEGLIYTVFPLWFHVMGLPEVVLQALLLSTIACYWVGNPQRKWVTRVMTAAFVIVLALPVLGLLARP